MVYNVKIVYTGPAVENIPDGDSICRTFVPNNSYIDTPAYDGTVYDTNVDGFGKVTPLEPFASTSFPFPIPLSQFKLATVGKYDKKAGGTKVEFRVPTYMEAFWYMQAGVSLADQGFTVEVKSMTDEEAEKKALAESLEKAVVIPEGKSTVLGKKVEDLQENIDIEWEGNIGSVTGTLKKVDNFTEFSNSDNSGNFFCVHLDDSLKGQKMGLKGKNEKKDIAWDPDLVFHVQDKTTQFIVTVDDKQAAVFDFTNVELKTS